MPNQVAFSKFNFPGFSLFFFLKAKKHFQLCLALLKVSKFQNENMKSSHCPKYERKNLKNSVLSIQDKKFQIFRSYSGQCDDFILSFWNLLTFSKCTKHQTSISVQVYDLIFYLYHLTRYFLCFQIIAKLLHQNGFKIVSIQHSS